MATHQLDDDIKKLMKEMNPIKINEDESFLETRLRLLDIHFNWDLWQMAPQSDSPESVVSRLQEKIEELVEHTEFKFLNFNLQLIIAQELMKYDLSNGLQKIRDCEQLLKCHKSNNCQEYLFTTIFKAMEYIVMGCKAFALFKCGIISETKEILQNLPSCNEMNDKERSGVFGMKACAYMEYGINGFHKALEYINEARTRDPLMPDWHFLTSKVMGRIRRFKFPFLPIPEDEEKFCRTAYELRSDNPTYMMYIAQITREKASKLFNEYRNENPRKMSKNDPRKMLVDNLNREASSLYQKLILKENDSHILCRSAFGMVKLPEPYRCLDLAVEAIEKALKISPNNPMANHYAGLIYIRHLKDNENGMKYLQIAASLNAYGAHADLLRLKYSLDRKNYDPIPELTDLLKYKDNTGTTYTQIASWYFFNKVDLFKAWQYLKKVTIDPSPRAHKSLFLRMNNPCDLFEVMFDEVKLRLAQRKYESENERESLMAMGVELRKLCPDAHPFHYERLKIAILNKSDQLVERESKPNYNRGPRGGRGRGRGRGRGVGRGGGDRNVSDFFGGFKKDKSSSRDRSRTSKERTSFGNERNRDRKNSAEKYATSRQRTPSSSRNRNSQTLSNNNGRNSSPSVLYNRSKPNSLEKLNFDQNLADKSLKPESPSNKSWATGCKGLVTQSQTSMEWYNSRRPRSFQDVNYKQQGRSWSSASNRWGESKNSNTYTDNKQMRFRNKSAENYCSYRDRESNNIRRSTENIARKGTETPISKLLSKKEESEKAFASWCFERTGHLPVVSNSSAESNFLPDFAKK